MNPVILAQGTVETMTNSAETILSGLKDQTPAVALSLVIGGLVVIVIWLVLRPTSSQNKVQESITKIASTAITDLGESTTLNLTLTQQVGQLRIELNRLSADVKEMKAQNKSLKDALDSANKKLDALNIVLAAKEASEATLLKDNLALRTLVKELQAQVADLQFQLNQFLKLPMEEPNDETQLNPSLP